MHRMYLNKNGLWQLGKEAKSSSSLIKGVTRHLNNWGGEVWCVTTARTTGKIRWIRYSQWHDLPTFHETHEVPKKVQMLELLQ